MQFESLAPRRVVEGFFGAANDAVHRAHDVDGVVTNGRFTRQHHGTGAVEDGVGDVGHLGARRHLGVGHGLEHLRRHHHGTGETHTSADDALLEVGNVFDGQAHTEVATGHHQRVSHLDDFGEVVDALFGLDLGHHQHIGAGQRGAD